MTPGEAPLARRKPVFPSKLATHALCPLRYLYETERPGLASLPRGPGAVKGMAVHGLVEACRRHGALGGLSLKQELCRRLATCLAKGAGGILARDAVEQQGLDAVFPRGEIVAACQVVARLLATYGEHVLQPVKPPSAGSGNRKPVFGSEVWLEDEYLDLAGKADLVYRALDGIIHVVDFKTSRVAGLEAISEHHILQLVAYAVLVERKLGDSCIVIELATPAGTLELEIDDAQRSKALAAVASVTRNLPRGTLLPPSTLAAPGGHCKTCAYRVSCRAYLVGLLATGGLVTAQGGYDLMGTVTSKAVANGLASFVIRRSNGEACRLDGIPEKTWPGVEPGDEISAFNVGCREVAGYSRSPRNFFVFRRDDPAASAYRAFLQLS